MPRCYNIWLVLTSSINVFFEITMILAEKFRSFCFAKKIFFMKNCCLLVYIETTFICDYECKLKTKNTNKRKLKIQTKYITRNAKDTKDFMIVIKKSW